MAEINLINLSKDKIIVVQDDIYIEYGDILHLDSAYEKSKKLQKIFQKNIIFRFNGYDMEVGEKTTLQDIEDSYYYQHEVHYANHTSRVLQNATKRLKEQNIKRTIQEVYRNLSLQVEDCNFKPYIKSYDQKQFATKLFRIYKMNHKNERIELLPPIIEVPKVKIKQK